MQLPMDWDFNSRPMAITEPPLARSPEPSSHATREDFGHGPPPLPKWPIPMTASSRSLSFGSLSTHHKVVKCGRGKHSDVELIPQPSDDRHDPLNWPRWRKDLNLISLLATVGLVGAMKTAFVTTSGAMATQYNASYTAIAALTSVPVVLSTVTGLASSMIAKLWGKRPMYLASALLLLAGCIWTSAAGDSFASCMGSRVLQGLGWGAFDTLVLGSIQDTYFEHERNLPVSLYNIFTIATTWGSPLIGGLISNTSGSFTTQFRIISGLHALSLPLLALGSPETAFDRSRLPVMAPSPGFGTSVSRGGADDGDSWSYCLRHHISVDRATGYVKGVLNPPPFKGPKTLPTALQAPRALIAPTTCLLFALSSIPHGALWGFATSVALFTAPPPLALGPASIGALMVGPWIMATAVVGGCCFYRGFHQKFTRRVSYAIVAVGTFLVLIGLLSFGLGLHNFMTLDRHRPRGPAGPFSLALAFFTPQAARQLSLPLLSFQLGVLAAGLHVLDTTTRPLLVRSASFTSSSIAVAHRSIGDMHAGVIILRNLAAAVFVAAMPAAITHVGGLKAAAIGLAVAHACLAAAIVALCWFGDEAVWRADGRVMGLVDLRLLKQSVSFFEHD
ncbi:major facilitator superfamily protein [Hirsutella rhossiliensis]|uniref:Major facilitator superfamily domain-containing protein n=1 Tax=Hirsutella rhossiliensis TaxID=111463 RepID=A0A9P8N4W4_9HYPO|nr:major facilitator superfamily domain-containing protein [Hirsutella rhossiliensis]KAH0966667.1 major facilitator superfamily domain-containing protein [Hirsutella rhossiliensis]